MTHCFWVFFVFYFSGFGYSEKAVKSRDEIIQKIKVEIAALEVCFLCLGFLLLARRVLQG